MISSSKKGLYVYVVVIKGFYVGKNAVSGSKKSTFNKKEKIVTREAGRLPPPGVSLPNEILHLQNSFWKGKV